MKERGHVIICLYNQQHSAVAAKLNQAPYLLTGDMAEHLLCNQLSLKASKKHMGEYILTYTSSTELYKPTCKHMYKHTSVCMCSCVHNKCLQIYTNTCQQHTPHHHLNQIIFCTHINICIHTQDKDIPHMHTCTIILMCACAHICMDNLSHAYIHSFVFASTYVCTYYAIS